MESSVNKELLEKYFEGETTIFEKKLIDDWAIDPANQDVFYQILSKHETRNPQFVSNVELALQRLHLRIQIQETNIFELPQKNSSKFKYSRWVAAAVVLFLIGFGGWINRSDFIYQTFYTDFGDIKTIKLSDGSTVVLNANSSIKIPRFGFGKLTREVFLEGEAQFLVKHMVDNQPFIVKTANQFEILVLGTEFNVFTRSRRAKVILNTGKIQLSYQEGTLKKKIIMKPGDLVTLDKANKIKKITPLEILQFSAWKEHRFVFDETSLEEITQLFEDNFGIKISIEDKDLLKWTVSGSFTAFNADELLETLTEASNLKYQKEGNLVIIFKEK